MAKRKRREEETKFIATSREAVDEKLFKDSIAPYLKWARDWWLGKFRRAFFQSGCYSAENAPKGLWIWFSEKSLWSPFRGVQAYPYVEMDFLAGEPVSEMEEFILPIRRHFKKCCVCLVPKLWKQLGGRYIWVSDDDLLAIASGLIDTPMRARFKKIAKI